MNELLPAYEWLRRGGEILYVEVLSTINKLCWMGFVGCHKLRGKNYGSEETRGESRSL